MNKESARNRRKTELEIHSYCESPDKISGDRRNSPAIGKREKEEEEKETHRRRCVKEASRGLVVAFVDEFRTEESERNEDYRIPGHRRER